MSELPGDYMITPAEVTIAANNAQLTGHAEAHEYPVTARTTDHARIIALERRVNEQDRRITDLFQVVEVLAANQHQPTK